MNPIFQHRHFKVIAEIISKMEEASSDREAVARHFANALSNTNPKFSRSRFMSAARGEPDNSRDRA